MTDAPDLNPGVSHLLRAVPCLQAGHRLFLCLELSIKIDATNDQPRPSTISLWYTIYEMVVF